MLLHTLLLFFSEYTIRIVITGGIIAGVVAGVLGAFTLVRQQSLLGDAIAHASLPGIVTTFLMTGTSVPAILMIGAISSSLLGVLFMQFLLRTTCLKKDAILGIMLSVFFGIGLILLTIVQKTTLPNQAVLNKFLFGSAAILLYTDLMVMAGGGCLVLLLVFLFFKEYCLISFYRNFAYVQGYPVHLLDWLLHLLLVLAISIGLQTVGVVLVSTLLIAPAAAARQWTISMHFMVLLAAFFGASAAIGGIMVSSLLPHLPTGPCMVVIASIIVGISLICAPKRGLLQKVLRTRSRSA